ncbi:DUF4382 domain-containing protein [Aquiflexum gelatinilyticum]|uniref:DUF4382 domain-containing protein n=1 Tax=Aquiflexum gelatinilyticum TaxID=2961943 RepID=A0A9X2SZM6_9BACT|nr:DUF4382 domain-containing protein [Aquiflexum gelatinilyticum]MCR9016892.1 DUF4382 domain-containing protein [Aquiflexum gelatinilyticum]
MTDGERSTALVNVFVIDAPGDFEEVWVEILGVEVKTTGTRGQDNANPIFFENVQSNKQVNLSSLILDKQFLVGRGELLVGAITELTLKLGTDHYVVIDGARIPLVIENIENQNPSLTVNYPLDPGISYDIFIDFEVFRSITASPNPANGFVLKPKLRSFTRADTGEIAGSILPVKENAVVYAIQGKDTVSSTAIDLATGKFKLRGVLGTHTVSIIPFNTNYQSETIPNVNVEKREITQINAITLRLKP